MQRILVAGVGHPNLKDLSFGQIFLADLADKPLPQNVDLENLSFGAIAVMQWFQDSPGKYEKVLFITGVEREGRKPGTVNFYKYDFPKLDEADVQGCVAESVTGIIGIDNLLSILNYFKALPKEVDVLEIEPFDTGIGFECSPEIEARSAEFYEMVLESVTAQTR